MIELNNITKEFKIYKKYEGFGGAFKSFFSMKYDLKRAVDNMTFHINEGESVGYIGVNGAGKSTTIKIMTGILTPSSGLCKVNGIIPYEKRKENAKNIGVVFGQRTQLWWDLPVSESFGILQKIYDIPKDKYKKNLAYLKEILGLEEFYLTPVRSLSLGQRMRADFAAALIHEPKILFLDEPTIGLDLLVKDNIRVAIKEINEKKKTTIILTTHDLDDIEEICKKIIVIDNGQKIYEGTVNDLKEKFGKYRQIKFDIRSGFDKNVFSDTEDMLCESTIDSLLVKFKKDKYKIAEIISKAVKHYEIKDIFIIEPQLEDIVKEIYSKKSAE